MCFPTAALLSVTKCQLGNSVTFTCWFPDLEYSNTRVKWYKQNIGGSLKLITTLMKATEKPTFERGFPQSRFDANSTQVMSMLTIFSTVREDEALYHCAASTWSKDHWNATYLSLNGNDVFSLFWFFLTFSTFFIDFNPLQPFFKFHIIIIFYRKHSVKLHCCSVAGRKGSSSARRLSDSPVFGHL